MATSAYLIEVRFKCRSELLSVHCTCVTFEYLCLAIKFGQKLHDDLFLYSFYYDGKIKMATFQLKLCIALSLLLFVLEKTIVGLGTE